jgi:hypothetical protein
MSCSFYQETPVDAEGKNGVTPLHVAVHYDNTSLALLLLEKASFPAAHAFILTQMRALSTWGCIHKVPTYRVQRVLAPDF